MITRKTVVAVKQASNRTKPYCLPQPLVSTIGKCLQNESKFSDLFNEQPNFSDTNGNISTSAMRVHKDSVELDLRPRFPLFGGWKTHYTLGYNVPSFEYLFHTGDNYLLKMRLVDHIYDDMAIDEVVVKIILPEGSTNIKLITPYPVTRKSDSLHYTYLDTFGRPVIEFTKTNLVENHIHEFNLKYTFARIVMIQEPLLIVGFLYILFLCVIVWMRLDFSITKEKEPHLHKE